MRRLILAAAAGLLAAQLSAAEAPKPGSDKDKLVCKREVPVGSLIASRKVCLTGEQWRKRQEDGNAMARGLIEDGAGACGQNGGACPF